MPDDDPDTYGHLVSEPETDWRIAEELLAGVVVFTPGVAWHQGWIGFETVVVAYLALLTFFVAMAANQITQ